MLQQSQEDAAGFRRRQDNKGWLSVFHALMQVLSYVVFAVSQNSHVVLQQSQLNSSNGFARALQEYFRA
jgi:hypothetical protein